MTAPSFEVTQLRYTPGMGPRRLDHPCQGTAINNASIRCREIGYVQGGEAQVVAMQIEVLQCKVQRPHRNGCAMRQCHDGGRPEDQECLNRGRAVFNQPSARSGNGYRTSMITMGQPHILGLTASARRCDKLQTKICCTSDTRCNLKSGKLRKRLSNCKQCKSYSLCVISGTRLH